MQGSNVQVVRLHRLEGDSRTRAFADVSIGDFVIRGVRIVEGKNGLFLSMPQEKSKDGKYYNVVTAASKEVLAALTSVVMEAYQQ